MEINVDGGEGQGNTKDMASRRKEDNIQQSKKDEEIVCVGDCLDSFVESLRAQGEFGDRFGCFIDGHFEV